MILSQTEKIDIIGDVHGHYQQLIRLTEKMGYSVGRKKLHHPENRKLGFVGDFINRGPQSVEVLTLVKSLCESGDAIAVLGNHEFRLIQNSVEGKKVPAEFEPFVPWLRSLPLFIELNTLRIVHAVWHFSSIELLDGKSVEEDAFIQETIVKKSPYKKAVSRILSGIKINIPEDLKLMDRFGIKRSKARLKWWMDLREKPYADCFLSPMKPDIFNRGPAIDELSDLELYNEKDKPVFTGHYCLPPNIPKVSGNVVCLDGCVTCDKTLWGYRHQGKDKISASNLIEAN
ncbi:MAG: hypothetical protein CMI19_01290 [Opitutae bacterium]|nr:hypothetical protein [Opitutae bacterium]